MRFTVTWDDDAQAELTDRWLLSSSDERRHPPATLVRSEDPTHPTALPPNNFQSSEV